MNPHGRLAARELVFSAIAAVNEQIPMAESQDRYSGSSSFRRLSEFLQGSYFKSPMLDVRLNSKS